MMNRLLNDEIDREWMEEQCGNFISRLDALEGGDLGDLNSRITALETPVESVGEALPTDLNTTLVLGLLTAVAPAMNSTNNRVNAIAGRVNALQDAMVEKGMMAA